MQKLSKILLLILISNNAIAQNYQPYPDEIGYGDEFQQPSNNYNAPYQDNSYNQNEYNSQTAVNNQNNQYYDNSIKYSNQNWELGLIAAASYTKKYKGADNYTLDTIIMPDITYNLDPWQKLFISYKDGAGYSYKLTDNLELGAGLGYRQDRDSKDAKILTGLNDVDDSLTYKAFAKYHLKDLTFGVSLNKGLRSSNDGLTTKFSASYLAALTDDYSIGTNIGLIYGNDTYMKQNFGVSASNATSYRSAYKANSGFSELMASVYTKKTIIGNHSIINAVNYSKLLGDAKNSSIVENEDALSFTIGYSYKF